MEYMFQVLTYVKINILTTAAYDTWPNNLQHIFSSFILDNKCRQAGVPDLLHISNWCAWGSMNFHLKETCLHTQEKEN